MAPYGVETEVAFEQLGSAVRLRLTFDRMHDDVWTQRAAAGWEMELNRLGKALAR